MGLAIVDQGGIFEVQRDGLVLISGVNNGRLLQFAQQSGDAEMLRGVNVALGLEAPAKATAKTQKLESGTAESGKADGADDSKTDDAKGKKSGK